MKTKFTVLVLLMVFVLLGVMVANAAPPVAGAVFTRNDVCKTVNGNIYHSKDAIYLNGGPAKPGAAGLPNGSYYVQVTTPNGAVLGKSAFPAVAVKGGEFVECYQLSAIVYSASSGFMWPGYDFTTNAGGEYKVWVSNVATFDNNSSKTDNFKVRQSGAPTPTPIGPQ